MRNAHRIGVLFGAACLALNVAGVGSAPAADPNAVAMHEAAAKKIATEPGEDLTNLVMLCRPEGQGGHFQDLPDPPLPSKIFDNLYYLGANSVGAYTITTSAGVILIDSMNSAADVNKYIIPGLKGMGVDPQTVKYVIATHGHSDHYGGMQELKRLIPGTRLAMGGADWDYAMLRPETRADRGKPPARDMTITDGQKLTLGDTTLTIYVTPGHTPGSVAFIIPVKVGGVPHTVSLWGGTSLYNNAHSLAEYRMSLDRFRPIEKSAEVQGRLSTHPYWTNTLQRLQKLRANPNGPNPFLTTVADMGRYERVIDECWKAEAAAIP